MEGFAAVKLEEFEQGKITRRGLIEALTLAATAVHAADANAAPAPSGLEVALVNHISYISPNCRQAADWYSKIFNLEQINVKDDQVTLPLGKKGEKPLGVDRDGVPMTFLVFRTRDANAPSTNVAASSPKPSSLIDHVGYTVADFDKERIKADLKAIGIETVREGGMFSLYITDPFGYDVQVAGLSNNALTEPLERNKFGR